MLVNQKQLSQYLGISTRRIRQLREDGVFKKREGTAAGYSLEECIQEYIEYKVNAETGRRTSISKEEVQAEHEEVKKQISVLKLRKLRRELHDASNVEYFLSDMLVRFRKYLMAIPPRLAMQVAEDEKDVLAFRYIKLMKWEDICVEMGFSWNGIHKLHSRALNRFMM